MSDARPGATETSIEFNWMLAVRRTYPVWRCNGIGSSFSVGNDFFFFSLPI